VLKVCDNAILAAVDLKNRKAHSAVDKRFEDAERALADYDKEFHQR
jgi:hypothetical protein